MAPYRLSRLQQRILHWLAIDQARTRGVFGSDHVALVKALGNDAGNVSHSLKKLEQRGLITMERTAGGKATAVWLTAVGQAHTHQEHQDERE